MKKVHIAKNRLRNRLLVKLLFISIISILAGIFYMAIISKQNRESVEESLKLFFQSINKLNYQKAIVNCLCSNIFYLSAIWLLGISIIGIPFIIFILMLKSFILGFSISSILYFYKLKGILIAMIYIIPLVINLFIILFLGYYAIIFSKNLNKLLFLRKEISFKNIMRRYSKIFLFCLGMIALSSIIEIYVVPNLLKLLQI